MAVSDLQGMGLMCKESSQRLSMMEESCHLMF